MHSTEFNASEVAAVVRAYPDLNLAARFEAARYPPLLYEERLRVYEELQPDDPSKDKCIMM